MHKFRRTLGATTLVHDKVVNLEGETIGRIEELMVDVTTGRVAYAVLSFGGFLGIGNKLFALPWSALTVDEGHRRFVVNVTRETLEKIGTPFFTTRSNGTGLGVAQCQRLVGTAGGRLRFHSEQGVGTTVTIVLPLAS